MILLRITEGENESVEAGIGRMVKVCMAVVTLVKNVEL